MPLFYDTFLTHAMYAEEDVKKKVEQSSLRDWVFGGAGFRDPSLSDYEYKKKAGGADTGGRKSGWP